MIVIDKNDFNFWGRNSIKVVKNDIPTKIENTEQNKKPAGDSNENNSILIGD